MNIEFHAPNLQVKEWIISYVTHQLLDLQHRHKHITRAQVYFRDQDGAENPGRICRIDLSIFRDSLYVQRKADSYEQAMREVLSTLSEKVNEKLKLQKVR